MRNAVTLSPGATRPRTGLAGGTIRVLLAEALVVPAGLITSVFLARVLGPEPFGVFMVAASVVVTLEWIVVTMFSRATVRLVAEAADWRPVGAAVLRWHVGLGLAAGAALWLSADAVAAALDEPLLAPCLALFAIEVPLACAAAACRSILTGRQAYRARAIAGAARWIARPVFVVALVAMGLSLTGAILGSILAALGGFVAAQLLARVPIAARRFPARRLWHLALPVFVLAVSLRLLDRLGLLALKALGGSTADAGWYAAAQSFSVAPGVFAMSFSPLLLAALTAAQTRGDEPGARRVAQGALRLVIGFVPLAAFGAAAAPEVVDLIFGSRFHPAARLVGPLLLGAVALAMISVASAILIARDRVKEASVCLWPLLPLAAAGHVVMVPRLGGMGAALVTCVAAVAGAVAALAIIFAVWRVRPPWGTCARSLLLAVLMAAVALAWPTPGLWLLVKAAILTAAIAAGFVALGELDPEDRRALRRIARGSDDAGGHLHSTG